LLNFIISNLQDRNRSIATILSPLSILAILGLALESLFQGKGVAVEISFNTSSTLFTSFYWAAQYLTLALGLTLIYKVQRFGNFGQAEIMLFGAYIGITMMWSPYFSLLIEGDRVLYQSAPKDGELTWDLLFWACILAFLLTGLLGVTLDRLIYSRFRQKNSIPQIMMIASLGISMILRAVLYLRYRAVNYRFVTDPDWIDLREAKFEISSRLWRFNFGERFLGDSDGTVLAFYNTVEDDYYLQYTKAAMIVGIFSVAFLLLIGLNVTKLGRQMRAVADNPDLAAASGINVEKVHAQTAFLAAGISGMCGVLLSLFVRVNPNLGLSILLPSFAVIVLGTLGSVRGAIFASLIVGFVRTLSESVLIDVGPELGRSSYSAFGEAMPYMFLVGALMTMPKGIGDAIANWEIQRARTGKGTIFNPMNVTLLLAFVFCTWLVGWFGFVLWLAMLFWAYLLSHIKVSTLFSLTDIPEIPYIKEKFRSFTNYQRVIAIALVAIQIVIVSILDIRTSGVGTVFLVADYVFLILNIIGLLALYSLIASCIPELKKFYGPLDELSSNQKVQLFSLGFLLTVFSYGVDILVAGTGQIYLVIDWMFLFLEASGLLLMVFILFFSRNELIDLQALFNKKLRKITEIQVWIAVVNCALLVLFAIFLDTITSGSGRIYYMVDVFYLFVILCAILLIIVITKNRAEVSHRINISLVAICALLVYFEAFIDPHSRLYITESAFFLFIWSFNDVGRFLSRNFSIITNVINQNATYRDSKSKIIEIVSLPRLLFGIILYYYVPFDLVQNIGVFFMLYSINPLADFTSKKLEYFQKSFWEAILPPSKALYGSSSERGSWFLFAVFFIVLSSIAWNLPSESNHTRHIQLSRIIILLCVYSILAISLNLHTGLTGMTNFGVILFAGLGAITVGILTVPEDKPGGHGWSILSAVILAMLVSAAAGWFLAYPTARLRMDYFAIVTISLGEMLRISMRAEPLLRAGTGTSAIGIQLYPLPFKEWWESTFDDSVGEFLALENSEGVLQVASYNVFLSLLAILLFLGIWLILGLMVNSPWGRILRAIREDEEVTMHHGHSVFYQKATSLALGASIAALGGALWAWLKMSILDDFLSPVFSTFLIWAAFIVGGKGNNKAMVIGAFIIVLNEFVFNLMVLGRNNADNDFYTMVTFLDELFAWLILDVISSLTSDLSITIIFGNNVENVLPELVYIKVGLIGFVIVLSLLFSEKGLLQEVPKRPEEFPSLKMDIYWLFWFLALISVCIGIWLIYEIGIIVGIISIFALLTLVVTLSKHRIKLLGGFLDAK
jgi:ABC-type branched-subunit amino acid transport system permease subunit